MIEPMLLSRGMRDREENEEYTTGEERELDVIINVYISLKIDRTLNAKDYLRNARTDKRKKGKDRRHFKKLLMFRANERKRKKQIISSFRRYFVAGSRREFCAPCRYPEMEYRRVYIV